MQWLDVLRRIEAGEDAGTELAHAMVVARLMERRGRGWPLMRRTMHEFNGTEPEIVNEVRGKFVRVTFRLDPEFDLGSDAG